MKTTINSTYTLHVNKQVILCEQMSSLFLPINMFNLPMYSILVIYTELALHYDPPPQFTQPGR